MVTSNLKQNNMEELKPKNGRKSFYGKAIVDKKKDINGKEYEVLFSYGTEIIRKYKDGLMAIVEPNVISNTTSSHLKSFCGLNKQDYIKLYNGKLK